jgi:glycosyltransferase involved in cell wall biosynthesis
LPVTSLIISTYNRDDALQLCLNSVLMQTVLPDEIIIADDGSGKKTHDLVLDYKKKTRIPLKHVWQPDDGYQLARIRNKAFAESAGEYIIQVDGDLILEQHFISDHLNLAKKNVFVSGTRAMLDAGLTGQLLSGNISINHINKYGNQVIKRYNTYRNIPLAKLLYWINQSRKNYKYVLGCNMAFWKTDLETVNGYNEAITGWGKEDNELTVRLQNAGVQLRLIKHAAVVYHLHHPTAILTSVPANEQLLEKAIREKVIYVPLGLNAH